MLDFCTGQNIISFLLLWLSGFGFGILFDTWMEERIKDTSGSNDAEDDFKENLIPPQKGAKTGKCDG